jgi:hypothetical protein
MAFIFDPDKSKVATEILEALRNKEGTGSNLTGLSKTELFSHLSTGSNSAREQFLGLLVVHGYVAIHYFNDNDCPATFHTSLTHGARMMI